MSLIDSQTSPPHRFREVLFDTIGSGVHVTQPILRFG
jgi:hypothetical protein